MPAAAKILTLPTQRSHKYAFLISTTGWAGGIQRHLGSAGYSYFFAYQALRTVLEEFGTCQLVESPESRLPYLAAEARAHGFEPIHLAINPPQDVYLSRSVRTVIYPFWEFSQVPNRDFGDDTRQNWTRVLNRAEAVVAPCGFTATALQADRPGDAIPVIPVPLNPDFFDLPDWDPDSVWTYQGRHAVWTSPVAARVESDSDAIAPPLDPESQPIRGRLGEAFNRFAAWMGPRRMQSVYRWKQRLLPPRGGSLRTHWYQKSRLLYNRYVRRWLSDDAVSLVTRGKRKALRLLGVPEKVSILPGLPEGTLTLSGLVYATIFNIGDPRKNPGEIMSAFLMAFHDRPDVTLVIKLVTNPVREHHEVSLLRSQYEAFGIEHECRVVVITSYLSDEELAGLFQATTYYVNHSFGEGACLPLQQGLAGGRPALAPDHSAMADYIHSEVAFVTRWAPEPTHWPHDPEKRLETYRFRPLWSDLYQNFLESAQIAEGDRPRYDAMSAAARVSMQAYAGRSTVRRALSEFLDAAIVSPFPTGGWSESADY